MISDEDELLVAASQQYEKSLTSHFSGADIVLSADEFLDEELTQEDVERLAPLLDSQTSEAANSVVDVTKDNSDADVSVVGNDVSCERKTVKFGF